MKKNEFIGRVQELADLNALLGKKSASLVILRGRRRVGKSTLVDQFAKKFRYIKFAGLAPSKGVLAQDQRDEFAQLLSAQTKIPEFSSSDWSKLFFLLGTQVQEGRVIILFDEISWMAHMDPTFLPKLKSAWDNIFKKNPELIFIICGSISMWIEENIVSSTAFLGRISWTIDLQPLSLFESNQMLHQQKFRFSDYEKFKILSITGGIPWYIEQIQGQYNADQNIQRQCFRKEGTLTKDFKNIFHDLFAKRDQIYSKIIQALDGVPISYDEISAKTSYPKSGVLSQYLEDLRLAGFISKDATWSLKTGKIMNLAVYRLSDNYMRFYLKYIQHIHNDFVEFSKLPGIDSVMGLQFENLVVNNRLELFKKLNIDPATICYSNPFFQKKTSRQKGCQIDFLIQTKSKALYLCEIKFSRHALGLEVVEQVKEKQNRLALPRGMSILPVLVHVNGISHDVEQTDYFYTIINFSELLH